jgi:hypothetical protein
VIAEIVSVSRCGSSSDRPRVAGTDPAANTSGVPLGHTIKIHFDRRFCPASQTNSTIVVTDSSDNPIWRDRGFRRDGEYRFVRALAESQSEFWIVSPK